MKILTISDVHGKLPMMPDGCVADVCVLAGDLEPDECLPGWMGQIFWPWVEAIPAAHLIIVPGNHDQHLGRKYSKPFTNYKLDLPMFKTVQLLTGAETVIDGVKFYGTPYTTGPDLKWWQYFEGTDELLQKHWDAIPSDVDILITHAAQYGIGDLDLKNNTTYGSLSLRESVSRLKQLRWHIHGHIHDGRGVYPQERYNILNTSQTWNLIEI